MDSRTGRLWHILQWLRSFPFRRDYHIWRVSGCGVNDTVLETCIFCGLLRARPIVREED